MASNAQVNSAQENYKNSLENSLGGRLTQSQIEEARRYADSMGMDFDPKVGYVPKGYGKVPSPTSAKRRQSREQRSAESGNPISKGGATGLAGALGQYGTLAEKALMAKMMFNPGALTDSDKQALGLTEIGTRGYDNVPDTSTVGGNWEQRQEAMGVEVMTPGELRRREAEVLAGVERQNNAAIGAARQQDLVRHYQSGGLLSDENIQELTDAGIFSKERYEGMLGRKGYTFSDDGQMMYDPRSIIGSQGGIQPVTPVENKHALMGSRPGVTSGLQGLSMVEKNRLSSQGLLGSHINNHLSTNQYQALTPYNFDDIYNNPTLANASSFQTGSQAGLPPGKLMGTSALGQATGGYFG